LAELGAFNCFAQHRRAAMWKVEETIYDDLLGSAGASPAVSRASRDTLSRAFRRRRRKERAGRLRSAELTCSL